MAWMCQSVRCDAIWSFGPILTRCLSQHHQIAGVAEEICMLSCHTHSQGHRQDAHLPSFAHEPRVDIPPSSWHMASVMPDLRIPSQTRWQIDWLIANCTVGDRKIRVQIPCPRPLYRRAWPKLKPVTYKLQVQCPTKSATASPIQRKTWIYQQKVQKQQTFKRSFLYTQCDYGSRPKQSSDTRRTLSIVMLWEKPGSVSRVTTPGWWTDTAYLDDTVHIQVTKLITPVIQFNPLKVHSTPN